MIDLRNLVSAREPLTLAGVPAGFEPWLMAGTDQIVMDPDGWTIRSADGSRTAHSEHTIAITDGDPIVMTAR